VSTLVLVHCGVGKGQAALTAAKQVFPSVLLGKKGEKFQILGLGRVAWL